MGRTQIQSPDIAAGAVSSVKLANSGVSPGTYVLPTVVVNSKGIITGISGSGTISPDQIVPQGSASGLNADLLDGKHASEFSLIAHTHVFSTLTGISLTSPTSGEVLTYSGGSWVNSSPTTGVTDHGALTGLLGDDHTQYQLRSEKNAINGYMGLDASGRGSPSRFGSGTANSGTWLRGDGSWQVISIPAPGDSITVNSVAVTDADFNSSTPATPANMAVVRWQRSGSGPTSVSAYISPGNIDHGLLTGLGDDDHTQYLTSPRALTWIGTKSIDVLLDVSPTTPTNNQFLAYNGTSGRWTDVSPTTAMLTESGNLFFTDERAQDAVGNILTNSATVKWTYNDGSNTISAAVSPEGISHASLADLTTGDPHTQYQKESERNAVNGYAGLDSSGLLSPNRIPAMPLSFLSDVSPSGASNGQVLTYHAASGQWRNTSPTVGTLDHGALTGLTDDDHTQYLTSPRANTWLSGKTTTNLTEGSNLYYTDERAQDAFGAMVSPSATIKWSYSDAAGKITASVSPAGISHNSLADLTTGDPHTQYQKESEKNAANGYAGLDSATMIGSPLLHSGVMIAYKANTLSGGIVATSTGLIDIGLGELYIPFTTGSASGTVWMDSADLKYYDNDVGVIQTVERLSNKNVANGYAGLGSSGLVSPSRIPAMPLSFLSDVSPSSVTNGQVLTYHSASGQWRNSSPATPVVDHGALTGLGDDDHTQYHNDSRASTWLGTKSVADLLDVSPSSLVDGQVMTWDNASGRWVNETIPAGVTDHGLLSGLGDDDHTQYLTSPRADTWLASKTTTNLTEGGNLYYTDERVQDAVGAMVSPSSTIRWSYSDAAGKLQAFVSPANISHASLANLTTGDPHTQYLLETAVVSISVSPDQIAPQGTGSGLDADLLDGQHASAFATSGHTHTLVNLTDVSPTAPSNGQVLTYHTASGQWRNASPTVYVTDHGALTGLGDDDHTQYHNDARATTWLGTKNISELLDVSPTSASTGQVLTYNATSGRWYNSSPVAAYTNEQAQDAVGSILTNTSTIKWTYNDGSNTISADVSPANISHAALSNLTAGDPHTQYQLESEKNSVNGYMGLDSSGRGSPSRFGSGTANSTTWLRGDGSWQIISIPTPGDSIEINSVAVTDANFNNSTPVAPASTVLIKWQRSGSGPTNISAYLSPGVIDHGLLTGLGDDDHTQYHNDSRADTWFGTKTTTNLAEGTNLYHTPERVQDEVGAMVSPSSTIRWTYNDSAGKLQAFVSPAGISHASLADLTSGDPHTQYQKESEKNAANGYAGLDSATKISSPLLHSGVMIAYKANSLTGSITLGTGSEIHAGQGVLRLPSVSPNTLTTGAIWVDGIDLKTIKYYDVDDGSVTYSIETHQNKNAANGYAGLDSATKISSPLLHSGVMIAYKSNSLSGTITATASGGIDLNAGSLVVPFVTGTAAGNLWMDSADLKFYDNDLGVIQTAERLSRRNVASGYAGLDSSGLLSPSRIASDSITFTRFQNISTDTLVGRDAASSGDATEISLTNGLAFTGSNSFGITTNGVSNTMLAQMAASTLKGNNTGATANAADLSPALVTAMLNSFTSSLKGLAPASGGGTAKFLRADGSWASPPSGGSMALAALTDVSPTAPSNGQVLTYHSASAQWRNTSPTTGGVTDHGALSGLGDDDHTQYALLDGGRSFTPAGLKVKDLSDTFSLTIGAENMAADRTLSFDTFDADRTLTIKGSATIDGGTHSGTNTGDITLAGSLDYITLAGQVITRAAIDLTTDITGDLPFANLAQSSAASKLLGRGSASGAGDFQEITLGSGLSMTGTTLSSSGGASALADLTDVSPASLVNGQVLTYNSASGQWRNETPASGSGLTQAQVLARISFRG